MCFGVKMHKKRIFLSLTLLTHIWGSGVMAIHSDDENLPGNHHGQAAPAPMDIAEAEPQGEKRKPEANGAIEPEAQPPKKAKVDAGKPRTFAEEKTLLKQYLNRYEITFSNREHKYSPLLLSQSIDILDRETSKKYTLQLGKILLSQPLLITHIFNHIHCTFLKITQNNPLLNKRMEHFLVGTPKKRNDFLHHFIFKIFSQEDAEELYLKAQEFCRALEASNKAGSYNLQTLDSFAFSSAKRFLGPDSKKPLGQFQPDFLENPLWAPNEFTMDTWVTSKALSVFQDLGTTLERLIQDIWLEGVSLPSGFALYTRNLPGGDKQAGFKYTYHSPFDQSEALVFNIVPHLDLNLWKKWYKALFDFMPPPTQKLLWERGIIQQIDDKWVAYPRLSDKPLVKLSLPQDLALAKRDIRTISLEISRRLQGKRTIYGGSIDVLMDQIVQRINRSTSPWVLSCGRSTKSGAYDSPFPYPIFVSSSGCAG